MEEIQKTLNNYHRFDDGYLISFEYSYSPKGNLVAKMVFGGWNQIFENPVWQEVAITMNDVKELHATVFSNRLRRICCSVKLLKFHDVWCIDVDGTYTNEDPTTLEEVREIGDCYVIGNDIEAYEKRPDNPT